MLYKERILNDFDKVVNLLNSAVTGLDKQAITPQQLRSMIVEVKEIIETLQPFVNRERN